ncbi:hypothetical protein [Colwellia sp. 12G3]|uniref:hypothetical protein n=1 Tax=Colwellia sp. 12G3 TaxID=2058299 RepID=UPI000C31C960|nr:hypothetical protein [Colwellia sp. 12G3]PKI17781.1 hypothetical protein CXF71_01870 [Colwellia sp. 12G3]
MTSNKTNKNDNNLLAKEATLAEIKAMPFHQYFTVYFIAIFLVVAAALSSALLYFSQQSTSSQALITEHLVPLQTQLLQQTYLINANKLVDKILQNSDEHEFIVLQHELSLQNKKLSLLKSQHKNSYQQWFDNKNVAINLITRIESSQKINEVSKNNALVLLDTLLDAIKIQFNNTETNLKQAELLTKVENQLSITVVMLKRLNLQTPRGDFEQLSDQINSMFVADYAKQLAKLQSDSQGMADIVRDFIHFEDIILKRGLLTKWQAQLTLIDDYQQQLVAQQQQLQNILNALSENSQGLNLVINDYVARNKQAKLANQLPRWIVILFTLTLSCIAVLLWLTRRGLKSATQSTHHFINRALDGEQLPLISHKKPGFIHLQQKDFYSTESEQLVKKIQQINDSNYSEVAYLALTDRNQVLEEKMIKASDKQAALKLELELLECTTLEKSTSQLLLEQQGWNTLYLGAVKQLVLLGSSALTTNIINKNGAGTQVNYLYDAHLQGRELVSKLRQVSCYRYLQSCDAVLTFNDVNLVSQIQAILLNLSNNLFFCKNKVSVSIDEKILTEVNLDAELFSEMFNIYIRLLLSQETGRELALSLQLVDKNNGQQKICFSGHVQGEEKIVQLPHALQGFNVDSTEQSEIGDYFITLLQYQHGDDVSAKLTEQGYLFSFTLPLAVASNQKNQRYPLLLLPSHLVDIENVCLKLATKYLAMPIDVLLAVKVPEQYQRLQQLLQALGLQITFVTCERMLQQHWQSGRFAVLMTEIDCQPFAHFMVEEGDQYSDNIALDRGVFSLAGFTGIPKKPEEYSGWIVGELDAKSAVDELITTMQPWIKEQKSESCLSEQVIPLNKGKETASAQVLAVNSPVSFNFERYIKHQGSTELAIFMLGEYTAENIFLVEQLSHALTCDDTEKAEAAIEALLINSKILAADNLVQLCQHWEKLLTTQGVDNTEKVQISLMSKTKQAVQEINQYADAVV